MSNSNTTLMDLTGEYLQLMELAQDPDIDDQVIADTMEGIKGELSVKGGGYYAVINQLISKAGLYKAQAKRLTDAAKRMESGAEKIKERLKYAMEQMGMKELECQYVTARIRKNGGMQALEITGEVPRNYQKEKTELVNDTDKIRKDLEAGIDLSFAHLKPRGTYIKFD